MNQVIHFEIPAQNAERAEEFYNSVFGWGINDIPDMKYKIVHTGPTDKDGMIREVGFINGGMMERSSELSYPVITIDVPDIEEISRKIVENGGEIIRAKMNVGSMGYAAYFKDSEGNIVGLWQSRKR